MQATDLLMIKARYLRMKQEQWRFGGGEKLLEFCLAGFERCGPGFSDR
ncbi:hypothetical protein [Acetobacter estunensis]|nr:hypothetical protein [Acetobacter estunensis]